MNAVIYTIIGLAAVPATLFPFVFALRPWWRKDPVGRAMMTQAVSLLLLVDLSLAYRIAAADPPPWVRLVVFTFVLAGLWYQFAALLHARHKGGIDSRHRHTESS